jgi:hypothetical protein
MPTLETPDAHVELRFKPQWPYILSVRKFLSSFFAIEVQRRDLAGKIAMAATELLENAIKYCSAEQQLLRIAVSRYGDRIDLVVENAVDPRQVDILRREFAEIESAAPDVMYLRRMHEAAQTGAQGRLGLARIRYAAGARLVMEVGERGVAIHAIFSIEEV